MVAPGREEFGPCCEAAAQGLLRGARDLFRRRSIRRRICDRPSGCRHSDPVKDHGIVALQGIHGRMDFHARRRLPGTLRSRDGQVDFGWDNIGEIEELESALVGDDCCLPAEGEPSGNDLLVERRGEPGESVQATPRAQEMSLAGMVGEHVPVEIVTAGSLPWGITPFLWCEVEELVV